MGTAVSQMGDTRAVKVPVWARARAYTDEALMVVVGVMRDRDAPPTVRLSAANVILDRGWGKAPMIVTATSETSVKVDVSSIPADARATMEHALRLAIAGAAADALAPTTVVDAEPQAALIEQGSGEGHAGQPGDDGDGGARE